MGKSSDNIPCSTGDGTCLETCSHVCRCPARSAGRKQFMSGLRKKLNSLGTEMGLMEMMPAGVKSALTAVQSASRPEELGSGQRGHRLDSPVQRWDLQAVGRQTARSHW